MSRTAKLLIYLTLSLFVVSGTKAQISINPAPSTVPVCIDKADAYKLALADMQNTLPATWEGFVKEGRCWYLPAAYLYTIDLYIDNEHIPSRVVELLFRGERVWGIRGKELPKGVWTL